MLLGHVEAAVTNPPVATLANEPRDGDVPRRAGIDRCGCGERARNDNVARSSAR
jgi:hypothetical protein